MPSGEPDIRWTGKGVPVAVDIRAIDPMSSGKPGIEPQMNADERGS